jgi:hypothetical protein
MAIKCKRIIDGKTYNTETATLVHAVDNDHGLPERGEHLYQNRFGAFFLYAYLDGWGEDDYEKITPLSPDEAREWLEKNAQWRPEIIETLFGEMPEAGMNEVKFTLRLPESLRGRLARKAKENEQSLNAWIVRCLESCASDGSEA